jgi:hypothetical protein
MNDREFASVLTSWKEIARYVGKGVRTVQRWKRKMGFPVRRTNPGGKGSVLAVPKEIDSWVKRQQFTDGRLDLATLRWCLHELRIENRELRLETRELLRQLAELRSSQLTLCSRNRAVDVNDTAGQFGFPVRQRAGIRLVHSEPHRASKPIGGNFDVREDRPVHAQRIPGFFDLAIDRPRHEIIPGKRDIHVLSVEPDPVQNRGLYIASGDSPAAPSVFWSMEELKCPVKRKLDS